MIRKLINTLKYGSRRAKQYIIAALLFLLLGIASGIVGVIIQEYLLFVATLMGIIGAVALLQSLTDAGGNHAGKTKPQSTDRKTDNTSELKNTEKSDGDEEGFTPEDEGSNGSKKDELEFSVEEAEKERRSESGDFLKKYDQDSIKKLFKVVKAGKSPIPIVIDEWEQKKVLHCPAFVWKKKDTVNILVLDESARVVTMNESSFINVTYVKAVQEHHQQLYTEVQNKLKIYDMFENVMPTYFNGAGPRGRGILLKNQYVLGGQIAITPQSVKALIAEFPFVFKIFESMKEPGEYSEYFKKAYESRVLWMDAVISQQRYQQRISTILQKFSEDMSIINYDFEEELERMVGFRLITDEYAAFYKNRRYELIQAAAKRKK